MVKLQTKQSKTKLSISSSSKLINTILELPNSQSIYKLHRWNERFTKWPVADLAPSHTISSSNILYFIILRISWINNSDRETAAYTLVSMASRHRASAATTRKQTIYCYMNFNICQINEPADQIMFPDTTISHINIVTAVINPLTTVLTH